MNIPPRDGIRCQLTNLLEIAENNSVRENLLQSRIKGIWWAKKRITFMRNRLSRLFVGSKNPAVPFALPQAEIKAGDLVRVLPEAKIRSILDDWGGTKGCIFTPEMYKYCSKTYKVFKKVDYFYDEVKKKMCKCRNMVLLEDAMCSGKRKVFPADCDRNCFLFWHTTWLEKLE